MTHSQNAFTAEQYDPRARDYVESLVHSSGADLDQIEAELSTIGAARVLDLGCGGGHVSYRAAKGAAEVVACDISASMLEAVAATAAERGFSNISVRQASAEDLPFADGEFDAVVSRFTTHHWQDMEAGLRQARRVVKPGGRAMFVDSIAPANPALDTHLQAIELLRDASHIRNHTIAQWVGALTRAGFRVETMTTRVLRMEFPVWIARTRTPPLHADAIRSLQATAPQLVRDHFAVGEDGSFDLEATTFVASVL